MAHQRGPFLPAAAVVRYGKSEAGGGGSIVSTQGPINSYVDLQGDYRSLYLTPRFSDFGKKVQLIWNL